MNAKLEAINSLEFVDWSCSGSECEYVLVELNAESMRVLRESGFTEEEIDKASEDEYTDVSMLAFSNGAKWFNSDYGFSEIGVYSEWKVDTK